MQSVGAYLKDEREKQSKSLNEIAEVTRISRATLEAIEQNKQAQLPPDSYVKGFLKIYARELALDPEETVSLYEKLIQEKNWVPQKELKAAAAPLITGKYLYVLFATLTVLFYLLYRVGSPVEETIDPVKVTPPSVLSEAPDEKPPAVPIVETVPPPQSGAAPQESPSLMPPETAAARPPAVVADLEPAPVISAPSPEVPVDAVPEKFTVMLEALELNWLMVSVDGRPPFEIMLYPGETFRQEAFDCLNVRIGNAGGLELFFDGISLGVPGDPGMPLNLRFP